MKRMTVMLLALTMALFMSADLASAEGWKKKDHSMKEKVYKKVKMIKHHQAELKFSDEDVQKAVDIKMNMKKDLIRIMADLEIVKLDIKSAKSAKTLDVTAMNALLDKKYDLKKQKAKRVFKAYADVKTMLNDDQKAKMKEIYEEKMKH